MVVIPREVKPVEVALSVYPTPALSIERLENVAVPLTAFTVRVPESVPLDGFVPMERVTLAVLVVVVRFVLVNLAVDLSYSAIDPRIRHTGSGAAG